MKIKYIAEDGTEFEDEESCLAHEADVQEKNKVKNFKEVIENMARASLPEDRKKIGVQDVLDVIVAQPEVVLTLLTQGLLAKSQKEKAEQLLKVIDEYAEARAVEYHLQDTQGTGDDVDEARTKKTEVLINLYKSLNRFVELRTVDIPVGLYLVPADKAAQN